MQKKLEKWAQLLFDTGKRNNLINFRDGRGTAKIAAPDFKQLFFRLSSGAPLEIVDPEPGADPDEFIKREIKKLKGNRVLLVGRELVGSRAIKTVIAKSHVAIEESGVDIAYAAMGFIEWREGDGEAMLAPLLLVPLSFKSVSVLEPYTMQATGEFIVNPTLEYLLRVQFGIKLPEYEDESAEEYAAKLNEITEKTGWRIINESRVGIFSFLKMNMYRDLTDNASQVVRNRNVRALLGGEITRNDGGYTGTLHSVVDADSSQIEAIEAAKSGVSFVLQGPPGTGKSQTITNIIAECLADGKRVLFVSEKAAALSVVYDKLKKVGLADFCLELHSHKAAKSAVIAELNRTLVLSHVGVSDRADDEIEARDRYSNVLESYVDAVHAPRVGINRSFYELCGLSREYADAPEIDYVFGNVFGIDAEGEARVDRLFDEYFSFGLPDSDYRKSCWYGYTSTDVSYESKHELNERLNIAIEFLTRLMPVKRALVKDFNLDCASFDDIVSAGTLLSLIVSGEVVTQALADVHELNEAIEIFALARDKAKEIAELCEYLKDYSDVIYSWDGKALKDQLESGYRSGLVRAFSKKYRRVTKAIRAAHSKRKHAFYNRAIEFAQNLADIQQYRAEFAEIERQIPDKWRGSAYRGETSDWGQILFELKEMKSLFERNPEFVRACGVISKDAELDEKASRMIETIESVKDEQMMGFYELARDFDYDKCDVRMLSVEGALDKLSACLGGVDGVEQWQRVLEVLGRMQREGVRGFLDIALDEGVRGEDIRRAFKRVFYAQWADAIVRGDTVLSSVTRGNHDNAVNIFKQKDETWFEINRAEIKAKLSKERPNLDFIAPGSDVATLLREGEKKRKQMGVRALFAAIPKLIKTLKPCLLMSPLSVSTYLAPDFNVDVVIFDEASQIFVQDALGAIYRAKQLIVVGDSKQMPPSNFFNATVEDEESDETDFESVLDLAAASLPDKRLKWHYRSNHEQLIDFSNRNYYGGELVTFPSCAADREDIGVDFCRVDGRYDRDGNVNQAEAERVAELVYEHFMRYPRRSLGVVAFSIAQQELIDRILLNKRMENPEFETFFSPDNAEPFFIKNLETVQGDERDTIIFSVAYAPDEDGKLLYNFGPLNRIGGERRLNVAVTRARTNVKVVCSISGTDIDLTRALSRGAALLREYLLYAERGGSMSASGENSRDGLVRDVAAFIAENGYEVTTDLGRSDYRIDVAVKRPGERDYFMAVECDGAAYAAVPTVRDRDRLRRSVLTRMGWKHYRVWSADWFTTPSAEKEKLLAALQESTTEQSESARGNFEVELTRKKLAFPKYKLADINELNRKYPDKTQTQRLVRAVLESEAPVSEEWLLRRLCFRYSAQRVSRSMAAQFEKEMSGCERLGIIRRGGFIYLAGQPVKMRVPHDEASEREIRHISQDELSAGLYAVLKLNKTATVDGLVKLVATQLNHKLTTSVRLRLEEAMVLISDRVTIEGDTVSLKEI